MLFRIKRQANVLVGDITRTPIRIRKVAQRIREIKRAVTTAKAQLKYQTWRPCLDCFALAFAQSRIPEYFF